MDKWIALNNQTAGKDKIARLIQYFSRTVWDSLESKDCDPLLVDQFKTLEYLLSSFRKLMRFGKCLDVFYSSLKSIHYDDLTIRITLTFSKLSQALFLLSDHIVWISRTGMIKSIDSKKWTKVSNKYWLFSIIMNLARDVYEIMRLIDLRKAGSRAGITRMCNSITSTSALSRLSLEASYCLYGHKDVVVDTIKNICDIFIPLTAMGYTKLSPRTVGLLGVLSSAAGLIALVQPNAKLLPA